ncbi:beta-2-glycoprotein 1-like [Genypterus blacodes]|uniref:beta-2-glycoprotein 1-like n=1 Tax=Genypterus blacodes TaxID=154954 RepID=UPI003F7724A0
MTRWLALLLLWPTLFVSMVTSQQVCSRPELDATIEVHGLQRFFNPGAEVVLSCVQGYSPLLGPRKIVCGASGGWTRTRLKCLPKHCPAPDMLPRGELNYEDITYKSTINYTCDEGYILIGASSAVCLANGTWSSSAPKCQPVSCGLAPIPQFGKIVYDELVRGNTTDYGTSGLYMCLPPYVVIGNARAKCLAGGRWSDPPQCQIVTCPQPQNIANGYKSNNDDRDFSYMENVKYGCNGYYVLDGNLQSVCQENGEWSEKPACKASCSVGILRGRILYKGRRLWIKELDPNRVLHTEIVSVYCMNKARKCGYAVSTQCIDGRLNIPDCFEEPSDFAYKFKHGSLPSEIEQC